MGAHGSASSPRASSKCVSNIFVALLIVLCAHLLCLASGHPELGSLEVSENDLLEGDDFSYTPYQTFRSEPQYLVVAPSEVRPGQVYRIIVTLLSAFSPVNFKASLQRNGEEIASAHEQVIAGDTRALLMKVPVESRSGVYHLQVDGNTNGVPGGTGFINKALVNFSQRFLSILIQTNQLVYNIRQSIRVRVILLDMEMKPYIDPVDVFLIDSRGLTMKRWLSIYPFQGFVSVVFTLPGDYPLGWWRVRVVALGQVEEKAILLERWFTDRFDVSVSLPAFVSTDDEHLEGTVTANHTNYMPVSGNATVKVFLKSKTTPVRENETPRSMQTLVTWQNVRQFTGSFHFKYDLAKLLAAVPPSVFVGSELEVQVKVADRFYEHFVTGYARTRVINSTIVLAFVDSSPMIYKPGMPFETHLAVSYDGQVPLPKDKLRFAHVTITPSSKFIDPDQEGLRVEFDDNGVAKLKFVVPKNVPSFSLRADYSDGVRIARTQLFAVQTFAPRNRYLQMTSSTSVGEAGNYGIFQVRANFYMKFFFYIVLSKGGIITHGKEKTLGMLNSVTSFSVALSPEMSPSCKIIVYHVTPDGEIIADMLTLPIKGISRENLDFVINKKQDRSGNLIELIPTLATGSIIGTNAHDEEFIDIQGFNDITPTSAHLELYRHVRGHHKKVIWRNSGGRNEKVDYFVTSSHARDAEATFAFSDLIVFTNMNITTSPNFCHPLYPNGTLMPPLILKPEFNEQTVPIKEVLLPCLTGAGCYLLSQRCDGKRQCRDGSDESDCNDLENTSGDVMQFLLYRRNRNNYFYHSSGNDFGWEDTFTGYSDNNYVPVIVPERPATWKVNAIGVSQEKGFSILQETLTYDSARLFFITVEAPTDIVIGEQIGVKVAVFNYQAFEIRADVILQSSIDYRFVQVGAKGRVSHYAPVITTGNQQHLVYVKPYSSKLVHMPVVATTKGKIRVVIIGSSQVGKDIKEIEMNVAADGVSVEMHTSLLLDMTNQAHLVKFLNINVTEDPIIPFVDHIRRFVFGSAEASVSVIGDVVGAPGFIEDKLVDFSSMAIARPAKSGELMMFNFAYHFYTLLYLRLTDQLRGPDRYEQARQWLDILNQDYVGQITFFRNGSFVMFKRGPGSVWLSAYCARVYHEAIYAEWEHLLFIDPEIIKRSIHFVLHHQQSDGSFIESSMTPGNVTTTHRYTEAALTAHVLVTLCKVKTGLGAIGIEVANGKKLAVHYLEQKLPQLRSPFEVAVVTYALQEAGSEEAKVGFDWLERYKRVAEGMVYWSSHVIELPKVVYQSQRPFIQHREPQLAEAEAIEGTAYALMVYTRYGGLIQDQIVRWLNFMRLHTEGFVSTYDTIVAMEALIDFSFRTHVRAITNINFEIEPSSIPNKMYPIEINSDNLAHQTILPIVPNVWGHVTVSAKGAGYSVLQMHTKYNVDKKHQLLQPPIKSFELNVHVSAEGRNKSIVSIRSCGRWLLTSDNPTSGIAIMELDLPTGYLQYKPVIDDIVNHGTVPRLRRARVLPKSAVFMFDYLTSDFTCVTFTVERWFPVANSTRWLKAKLYDLTRPELFTEEIMDNYALYVLNVCEVCGSYQCPYCPFFSGTNIASVSMTFIITLIAFSIIAPNILNDVS